MKKLRSSIIIMMEMCMRSCCMCMAFYASVSDMFSISKAKHFAA